MWVSLAISLRAGPAPQAPVEVLGRLGGRGEAASCRTLGAETRTEAPALFRRCRCRPRGPGARHRSGPKAPALLFRLKRQEDAAEARAHSQQVPGDSLESTRKNTDLPRKF